MSPMESPIRRYRLSRSRPGLVRLQGSSAGSFAFAACFLVFLAFLLLCSDRIATHCLARTSYSLLRVILPGLPLFLAQMGCRDFFSSKLLCLTGVRILLCSRC
jgi:hypothetical protein